MPQPGITLDINPSDPLKLIGLMGGALGGRTVALVMFSILDPEAYEKLGTPERRYLAGPLVVGTAPGSDWEKTLPPWIPNQAHEERFRVVTGMMPGHLVAPCDIMAALYAPSLVAPLTPFASQLCLWAGAHGLSRWRSMPFEEAARMICGGDDTYFPADKDFLEPNGRHAYDYRIFATELREKVAARAPAGV